MVRGAEVCSNAARGVALALALALAGCGFFDETISDSVDTDLDQAPSETASPSPDPADAGSSERGSPDAGFVSVPEVLAGEVLSDVRVVDGDSLEATLDGVKVKIRIQGYNAPELYDDSNQKTCPGRAAHEALRLFMAEGEPSLVVGEIDRYGRTLGDVVVDGRSASDVLVADGRGLATGADELRRLLMQDAAERGFGIWGQGCGRPLTTDLAIGEVQVNPAGNDRYNLTEEWVEIVNKGSAPVDLAGWTLRDDTTGHRFVLSGVLDPGQVLTVRSGSGTSTTQDRYLGESYPVWSNDQETVLLIDPSGVHTDWRFLS